MATQGSCWDGYQQKGFKMKNGRRVPNCVPAGRVEKKSNGRQKSKV